jgi:hypothetical protein
MSAAKKSRFSVRRVSWATIVFLALPIVETVHAQTSKDATCACEDFGTVDGFHAFALLTPDLNWREKWNTPPETAVHFNSIGSVGLGDKVVLLTFFANPKLQGGVAEIECDLRLTKPNGEVLESSATDCFTDRIDGPLDNIRLTGLRVEIEVETTDPSGLWRFEVGVRDVLRDARIPLEVTLAVDNAE